MIFFKILIILVFCLIFWQDYKHQMVYWFLYPLIGILAFFIQLEFLDFKLIAMNSSLNLLFVTILLFAIYFYSKIILKEKLINQSIGSGDVLLFIFLCFTFSFVSFFTIFTFSLIFSLVLHLFFKNKNQLKESVPLAGYISLFFCAIYSSLFLFNFNFLFAY